MYCCGVHIYEQKEMQTYTRKLHITCHYQNNINELNVYKKSFLNRYNCFRCRLTPFPGAMPSLSSFYFGFIYFFFVFFYDLIVFFFIMLASKTGLVASSILICTNS